METHNIFTIDLMEEILLRLPVRHLLRSRCVSKSWCALIDSTRFIRKHHQIQSAISQEEGDAPLFLTSQSLIYGEDPSEFYLLSKKQGDVVQLLTPDLDRDRVPNDDPNHFIHLCCIGVVNGVVGLSWGDKSLELGLWNPATRDFKVVPPPPPFNFFSLEMGDDIFVLGFDPISSDFKIVRSFYLNITSPCLCDIYSLSSNSWISLELPSYSLHDSSPALIFSRTAELYGGACYWTATEFWDEMAVRFMILSFDFSTEILKFFDPPSVVVTTVKITNSDWMVGQYMELLALIFSRQNTSESLYSFEIWVASQFDAGDQREISLSWQHLFTIGPADGFYAESFVAFRVDGDVLLNTREGERKECNLYNPSTRTFKSLGLSFHSGYRYVESLFPLSKRQIQSYEELNKLKKRKRKQVLESFKNKYDETEDSESPSQSQDDAFSRPTASHYADDSFSDTRAHNCRCCHKLDSIKQQLDELKKALVSLARGEPIPAWMLIEDSNPPSQPPPV